MRPVSIGRNGVLWPKDTSPNFPRRHIDWDMVEPDRREVLIGLREAEGRTREKVVILVM